MVTQAAGPARAVSIHRHLHAEAPFVSLPLAQGWKASASIPSEPQSPEPPWLTRLSTWVEFVAAHKPGSFDTPARLVAFWPEAHMDEVRTDFVALAALYRRELVRSARPAPVVYRDTMIAVPELGRLLGLAEAEGAQERANRVLKRAAILYADVVMLVVPLMPGQFGCSAGASMLVKDGTRIGTGCVNVHWLQGRALLDAVGPDPAKDETVRLWYAATLAFLLQTGNYANARPQLEHARLLFRLDPDILFQGGYYHEAFASPLIQAAAVAAGSDPGGGKAHLDSAEDLYRRAVREDPKFVEARVRHGRVLALLGRRQDAARELRLAAAGAAAEGPQLRYYAELFLGQAEESVDNLAAARDHYLQAAAHYPQAQSPLLALALLARQSGDRSGVREAMATLLALPYAGPTTPIRGGFTPAGRTSGTRRDSPSSTRDCRSRLPSACCRSLRAGKPRPPLRAENDDDASSSVRDSRRSLSAVVPAAQDQLPTFSSRVEAVRVDVLVTDGGKPVRGLRAADFEVLDNGVRQTVDFVSAEQLPLNVVFTFDLSGSIVGERLANLARGEPRGARRPEGRRPGGAGHLRQRGAGGARA